MKIFNENSDKPLVISLCDYSGNWPSEYINNGYPVVLFDLKHGDDIIEKQAEVFILAKTFKSVLGIMAGPTCTDYTVSGAQYWKQKDESGQTAQSLKLVDSCLEIIDVLQPEWSVLENPIGRLPKLRPETLGKYKIIFDPCDYAGYIKDNFFEKNKYIIKSIRDKTDHSQKLSAEEVKFTIEMNLYTKKTCLWGNFTIPEKKYLEPIFVKCYNGDKYSPMHWYSGGKSEKTKELRSITPLGFARAFYLYNH